MIFWLTLQIFQSIFNTTIDPVSLGMIQFLGFVELFLELVIVVVSALTWLGIRLKLK